MSQLERFRKFLELKPADEEIKKYIDNLTFNERMEIFRETLDEGKKDTQ